MNAAPFSNEYDWIVEGNKAHMNHILDRATGWAECAVWPAAGGSKPCLKDEVAMWEATSLVWLPSAVREDVLDSMAQIVAFVVRKSVAPSRYNWRCDVASLTSSRSHREVVK